MSKKKKACGRGVLARTLEKPVGEACEREACGRGALARRLHTTCVCPHTVGEACEREARGRGVLTTWDP
jgi:hypothetical protein